MHPEATEITDLANDINNVMQPKKVVQVRIISLPTVWNSVHVHMIQALLSCVLP